MINFRKIGRFALSGGWEKLKKGEWGDADFLHGNRVVAVYDLQYTLDDDESKPRYVQEFLSNYNIEYAWSPLSDSEFNTNLRYTLETIGEKIHEWDQKYENQKDIILIKCGAGISRSATALIFYFCQYKRMSFTEALEHVRSVEWDQGVRFGASPNVFFWTMLKEWFPETEASK